MRAYLGELNTEREVRLAAATFGKEQLRSHINRIRETITRVLDGDTTLGEKLRTLFNERLHVF